MNRFRTRWSRLFLTLALVAWVMGIGARQIHEIVTLHLVCAEHGEIIEIEDGGQRVTASTAEIAVDDRVDDHDHDCALQAVASHAVLISGPVPPPVPRRIVRVVRPLFTQSARGPPLAYAPKTSPPLA